MRDFRRGAQIACTALIVFLVVAAGAGMGQDDSDDVALFGMAQVSLVLSSNTPGSDQDRAEVDDKRKHGSETVRAVHMPLWSKPAKPGNADIADPAETSGAKGKVIYLTFDDGPTTKYTERILDLLDEYDAKATFFQVGENATAHPGLTRSVIDRGHALGSHGWDHTSMRKLSPRGLNRQITRTSAALQGITGRPVTCLRPPFGAVNVRVKAAIRDQRLAMMLWDIDPRDWKRPGSAVIAQRVLSHAHSGAVSLMHDGGGNRSQSVGALKRILRSLSKQQYDFKTLPEC